MVESYLTVQNELGIHARVAARISNEAIKFSSSIVAKKDGQTFDLKKVYEVIRLIVSKGEVLTVQFRGEDEETAAEAFETLFLDKFGEK